MCVEVICDPYHHSNLKRNFKHFLRESLFGDVEIWTADVKIIAHKVILASSSVYFRTLFTTQVGSDQDKGIVKLEEFDSSTVKDVLEFMYTGLIKVSQSNAFELVRLEDLLQVWSLRGILSNYLQSSIDKSSCWAIKNEADFFHYEDVSMAAFMYIVEHFKVLIKEPEFLEAPYHLVKQCLDSAVLATPTEGVLLCNLVSWVMEDYSSRGCFLKELLTYVNPLELVCWADSVKVVYGLTANSPEAYKTMEEWLGAGSLARILNDPSSYKPRHYKPLVYPGLLAVGGMDNDGDPVSAMEVTMDTSVSEWRFLLPTNNQARRFSPGGIELPPMPQPRAAFASATVYPFHAYIIGGIIDDDDRVSNRVDVYSVVNNTWEEGVSLPCFVHHAAAASLDGNVYLSGGVIDGQPQNSFMVLPKNSKRWLSLCPMKKTRIRHSLVSCRGALYAIGGLDERGKVLSSVERYEPVSGIWTEVASMCLARHSFVAASIPLSSTIYVIRGLPVYEDKPTVEKYNAKKDEWRMARSGRGGAIDSWSSVFGGIFGNSIAMVSQKGYEDNKLEASSSLTVYSTVSDLALEWGPPLNKSRKEGALIPINVPLYRRERI